MNPLFLLNGHDSPLQLVADRFPHRKAFHRLAQIAFNENDMQGAHDLIFKVRYF